MLLSFGLPFSNWTSNMSMACGVNNLCANAVVSWSIQPWCRSPGNVASNVAKASSYDTIFHCAFFSFLFKLCAVRFRTQQFHRILFCSHMQTIFRKLLSFIWKSNISCWCRVTMPRVEGEMIFRDDQSVSIISPSTFPTLWMKLRAYRANHCVWCPWTCQIPIPGWISTRCHTPNMFGTVNMERTIDLRLSWSERWVRPT